MYTYIYGKTGYWCSHEKRKLSDIKISYIESIWTNSHNKLCNFENIFVFTKEHASFESQTSSKFDKIPAFTLHSNTHVILLHASDNHFIKIYKRIWQTVNDRNFINVREFIFCKQLNIFNLQFLCPHPFFSAGLVHILFNSDLSTLPDIKGCLYFCNWSEKRKIVSISNSFDKSITLIKKPLPRYSDEWVFEMIRHFTNLSSAL